MECDAAAQRRHRADLDDGVAMGFKVPRRTARVIFEEGHDYHGAEIELNLDVPLRALFEFQKLREDDPSEAFRMFAEDVLQSWNIEDDSGAPLPADYEGLCSLPSAFITTLMDRWVTEGTTAPVPLEQRSSDTDGSVVPLTQTAT